MVKKYKGIIIKTKGKKYIYNPNPTSANAPKLCSIKTTYKCPNYDELIKQQVKGSKKFHPKYPSISI